jgi:hypothetical protein
VAKLSTYLSLHQQGLLGRAARTFNSGNLVSTEYLAPAGTKVGDPCLFIEYIYDSNGNILSEDKSIETWSSTQETIAESTSDPSPATQANSIVSTDGNEAGVTVGGRLKVDADLTGGTVNVTATNLDIEDITITDVGTTDDSLKVKHTGDISIDSSTPISTSVSGNVSIDDSTPLDIAVTGTPAVNSTIQNTSLDTKNQTQYSDSTSNTQYWLGLEEDNQLTLQYVDDSVSNQKTIFYALPSVSIDGSCLARRYYLADDEVTGEHTYIGTWTQTMNDRIKPPPTDITVTSGSLTTVEDQVATTVLAGFSVTGGELPITLSMTSNGGLDVELSGANLVVASGGIDGSASGSSPFTVGIRATDAFDVTYDEDFSVTVTSNDITDIALSGTDVANGNVEGTDIGLLTCVGGVGDVNYSITNDGGLDNIKITDTGTSTATLEVDTGGIIDSMGTYTVRITATDSIPQTYYEDFTITVLSGFSNTKALNRIKADAYAFAFFNYGQDNAAWNTGGGTGNFFKDDWLAQRTRATNNWSMSMWFQCNEVPAVDDMCPMFGSAAAYSHGTQGSLLLLWNDAGNIKVCCTAGPTVIVHTPASSVDVADGEWHHYVVTWDGTANSPIETTSTNTSQGYLGHLGSSPTYDINLRCYIDGEECIYSDNWDWSKVYIRYYGDWNSTFGGPYLRNFKCKTDTYNSSTTPNYYGWGFGYQSQYSSNDKIDADYDEWSFHDITLTATQVGELYNSGTPVALDNTEWTEGTWTTANCLAWFRMFEGSSDSNGFIISEAIGPNGDGTIDLYDWDNTAGSEGYVASSPARSTTPTITIADTAYNTPAGNEIVTLTALADGDVYIP